MSLNFTLFKVNYYDKRHTEEGMEWYLSQMPMTSEDEVGFERSPDYFGSKDCARRIYKANPTVKIVLVVRNPIIRYARYISRFLR